MAGIISGVIIAALICGYAALVIYRRVKKVWQCECCGQNCRGAK